MRAYILTKFYPDSEIVLERKVIIAPKEMRYKLCPPHKNSKFGGVYDQFEERDVEFVGITVQPERLNPEASKEDSIV